MSGSREVKLDPNDGLLTEENLQIVIALIGGNLQEEHLEFYRHEDDDDDTVRLKCGASSVGAIKALKDFVPLLVTEVRTLRAQLEAKDHRKIILPGD